MTQRRNNKFSALTTAYRIHEKFITRRRVIAAMAAATLLTADAMAAEDGQQKTAVTDPSQAGEDFRLQGEYAGWICDAGRCRRRVGLQVCALGDGQFSAVEYPGGLPGAGWSRGHKFELSGAREGGSVWLASSRCSFLVDGSRAQAVSVGGHSLGYLCKVNRTSPTLGAVPPRCATVLFSSSMNQFKDPQTTAEGWLQVGTETLNAYQDFTMHLEFRLPYMPHARGQGRGNSGVYLQSRYEVQILDSFALEGEFNECGALYRLRKPDVNMCLPPLSWQTYDIGFRAPRFAADGTKLCDGRITVIHNGVPVHNNQILTRKTGAGRKEESQPLPTKLQDHGNPVVFRNIWLIDHTAVGPQLAVRPQTRTRFTRRRFGSRLAILNFQ